MIINKKRLIPVKLKFVLARSILNTLSIILFFLGIQYTSVTKANMLNMTSPVFVFFLAPFINKERQGLSRILYLLLVMIGAYLVINPDFHTIQMGDVFALLSGLTAGISTSALREARKYDETSLILFYLYFFAAIISFITILPIFTFPSFRILALMVISGVFGVLGQLTMSWGFSRVEACMGSVISASRILFSGIMGIMIFADPLNTKIIIGGFLILAALIGVSGILKRN
jgi:drug/metabolite transporter (DMT)-like permease